jgi:hypothetical protein
MTNHRIENGRRNFLLTIAGGIAGLAAGSLPARVLAQPAGGLPLRQCAVRHFSAPSAASH